MGTTLGKLGARQLVWDAFDQFEKEKSSILGKTIKGVKYSWNYREGKKTAVKTGMGLSIGMGLVAIGVATHGVGLAVIVPLAAGGVALGMANDTAFAKLWDRDLRGGENTRQFIQSYTKATTAEGTKQVEERAHKTIKRAFQHYLTAADKGQDLREDRLIQGGRHCPQAMQEVTEVLHVLHHLEKAWLYLAPALYLTNNLLDAYERFWVYYRGRELAVGESKEWHPDGVRCKSTKCYMQDFENKDDAVEMPLWTGTKLDDNRGRLKYAERTAGDLPPRSALEPLQERGWIKTLLTLAENNYERHFGTKLWHGITNDWERKTRADQVTFLGGHLLGVALTGATAGVGAGLGEALHGFDPLIEIGADFAEKIVDLALEHIEIGGHGNNPQLRIDAQGAKDAQEALRDAATHILEVYRINDELMEGRKKPQCDDMVWVCRQIIEIQHHLNRAEVYLEETIVNVTGLARCINRDIVYVTEYNRRLVREFRYILHEYCNRDRCFSQWDNERGTWI